jgi:hypothetical protein
VVGKVAHLASSPRRTKSNLEDVVHRLAFDKVVSAYVEVEKRCRGMRGRRIQKLLEKVVSNLNSIGGEIYELSLMESRWKRRRIVLISTMSPVVLALYDTGMKVSWLFLLPAIAMTAAVAYVVLRGWVEIERAEERLANDLKETYRDVLDLATLCGAREVYASLLGGGSQISAESASYTPGTSRIRRR